MLGAVGIVSWRVAAESVGDHVVIIWVVQGGERERERDGERLIVVGQQRFVLLSFD